MIVRDSGPGVGAAGTQAAGAAPEASHPEARGSGRGAWLGAFAALAGFLLLRSRFLFTTRLYESADPAANSILVVQAEHFTLLHGNYSREGFFHPGSAYLYLMAAGQWLFHDLTHLVPTQWNGQLIAILLLNSALMATVAWIAGGWAGSAWAVAAAAAVVVGFAAALSLAVPVALNPEILASTWMPDVYVPTFLAFLVAAASVAAGRTAHLWLLAATGSLLVHGHVEFLFFVPLIVAAVAAGALYRARHAPWAALRRLSRRWSHWVPAAVVSVVFAVPIVADLVTHWPGEFGKYLSYARSPRAGGHPVSEAARYLLWSWWPGAPWLGLLVLAGLVAAAVAVAVALPFPAAAGDLRRFLLAALGVVAVTTAAMLYYAMRGIDALTAHYIGFFYWSAPLLALLVVVTGLTAAVPGRAVSRAVRWAVPAGALLAALLAAPLAALGAGVLAPGLRADVHDSEPALAPALAALAARSPGRLIVLKVAPNTSFDADGLVVQAERAGQPICLAGQYFWVFAVTSQFICGPRQEATGASYQLHRLPYRAQPGAPVIARLRYSALTATAQEGTRSGG